MFCRITSFLLWDNLLWDNSTVGIPSYGMLVSDNRLLLIGPVFDRWTIL